MAVKPEPIAVTALVPPGQQAPERIMIRPRKQRRSRFIGFDHGIRAVNSGTKGRTYSVRNSYFEDNVCGIYTDAVRNATVLRKNFFVGGRDVILSVLDVPFNESHRGVYMYYANGFRVEENKLLPTNNAPVAAMEGVVVGYSGPYNDQVYKNEAAGVDIGFAAENVCVDQNNSTAIGLSFFCNDNLQNREEDFKVRTTLSPPPPVDHCIKMFQGSVGTSAGNTFTPWQNGSTPYYNFHNQAQALPITYFWEAPPGDLNNGAYNAPWVQRNVNISTNEHGCPTRITCGGTPQVKALLDPLIQQEKTAYLNLKYVFESLLDGGDFEGLKETIMESWPQDAWDLRNALMERSPYLSVRILKDVGLRNILPHAMYLEICLANPEATQQDRFVHWVQFTLPNPLPEYMVAQIVASWDQRTWRSNLESAMAWHLGEYQQLNDRVMSVMLNDSTPPPLDSLLVRWRANPSLRARYGEASILLEMDDFTSAENLLNGLDQDYRMDQVAMEERDDMLALIAVVRGAHVGDRSIMQLDNAEVGTLESIAARQPSLAASHARNILCFGYGICTPPITGEASQPKSQWTLPSVAEQPVTAVLLIHPNPANGWVAFSHTLGTKVERASIHVRDPQGREVYSEPFASSPGQLVWDTRKLAAGTYTDELHNKGKFGSPTHGDLAMRLNRLLPTAVCVCAAALAVAQMPLCVDPSFQAPFISHTVATIDFMNDGRILLGGQMKPQGFISHVGRTRLLPDGSLDPSFAQNIAPQGGGVRIWDDDYFFATAGVGVHRCFLSTGETDLSYEYTGLFFNSFGNAFHNFPDGRQWRTGWWKKRLYDEDGNQIGSEPGYGLIQRLPSGLADPDFDHKFTSPGWLVTMCETPDGRFLMNSSVGTQYEGRSVGAILRVWPDGQLDTTFHSNIVWGQASSSYYFYPDGRILAFGRFALPEFPNDTLHVIRLHPDGTNDTTWPVIQFRYNQNFFPGLGQINDHLELEPGRLIVVGHFDEVDGQPVGSIAAIDTAGNVLWDYFTGSDAGLLFWNGGSKRDLFGIQKGPDEAIYIYGSYSGFDDGCSNHPEQRMITRLYPINVGVQAAAPGANLQVFPNPAHDRLTIQCDQCPAMLQARMLDATGRVVLSTTLRGAVHQLDVSGLHGLFLLELQGEGVHHTERIIIE